MSAVAIAATTVWKPSYAFLMTIGIVGTGKDVFDAVTAIINRDWCGVVSGIGAITFDFYGNAN